MPRVKGPGGRGVGRGQRRRGRRPAPRQEISLPRVFVLGVASLSQFGNYPASTPRRGVRLSRGFPAAPEVPRDYPEFAPPNQCRGGERMWGSCGGNAG